MATRLRDTTLQSLTRRLDKTGGPEACWPFARYTGTQQYGRMKYRGSQWLAHRVAYTLEHGEIPEGLDILHSCDNPPCCNPAHLRPGTDSENIREALDKGRMVLPKGEKHPAAKLTDQEVEYVRSSTKDALALSRELDVSRTHIYKIRNGKARTGVSNGN